MQNTIARIRNHKDNKIQGKKKVKAWRQGMSMKGFVSACPTLALFKARAAE